MNSDSMDENLAITFEPFNNNTEDYMEACDEEVNDMIPRLQRLNIIDDQIIDEAIDLSSSTKIVPLFPMDSSVDSIILEEEEMADSNGSTIFVRDVIGPVRENEVTKVVLDNKKFLKEFIGTQQNVSKNMIDFESQEIISNASVNDDIHISKDQEEKQIFNDIKIINDFANDPLDFSLIRNLDYNCETESNFAVSAIKTEIQTMPTAKETMNQVDSENGEVSETSNIVHPENSDHDVNTDALVQCAGDVSKDVFDYFTISYSADVSSDDLSQKSNEIVIDPLQHPHDDDANSTKSKPVRKVAVSVPPNLGISESRQQRFGIFQTESTDIDVTGTSKIISSSDEDSNKPCSTRKASPSHFRRKGRRIIKSSRMSQIPPPSDIKIDEEKRPSPSKRKKSSSENSTVTSGKLHKRSVSERNVETGEKSSLVVRSRSLSPDSNTSCCDLVTNPPTEYSKTSQSRKRTNSDSQNTACNKYRKSSSSSDEGGNN